MLFIKGLGVLRNRYGMSEGANSPGTIDLRRIAAATAVVIGMVATAAVAYLLLDILLLLFVGIVVAAALQPWHTVLSRWGIPNARRAGAGIQARAGASRAPSTVRTSWAAEETF